MFIYVYICIYICVYIFIHIFIYIYIMVVQSARIADFRGNSTPLPSSGGSHEINQIQIQ